MKDSNIQMRTKKRYIVWVAVLSLFAIGCSRTAKQGGGATSDSLAVVNTAKEDILVGTLDLVVDESILPLLKEQEEVFLSSYPNAKLNIIARPEVLAVKELLADKAMVAILARELNEIENDYFKQRSITPRIFPVAVDGIILVKHTKSADTSVTVEYIFDMMKGRVKGGDKLVFNNLNSSSFRYLKELGKIEKVSSANLQEKNSAKEVLDEIVLDETKIGVLGYSEYLDLKSKVSDLNNIRILSVQNSVGEKADHQYYRPNQSTLAAEQYPLRRMFYVLNYQPNMGLGIGFSAFLTGDRGQRIVLKSGIVPATMPGREIIIRDNI